MAITHDRKAEIIKEYALTEGDTGSPEVQVALLTEHISGLTEHLKVHRDLEIRKDKHVKVQSDLEIRKASGTTKLILS